MPGRQSTALLKSTALGTLLQLIMVIVGHFATGIAGAFAEGGMAIAGVTGLLYSIWGGKDSLGGAALGGAAAGGLSAFLGILVSHFMGDAPVALLHVGTAGSAVTGAIGGMVGRALSTPSGIAH
ncbi:MAG TPA: hypothetical protein VJQ44_03975 [Gemmatimonadales bacterium]|nr:hypothetical protein [Gemmatimonadales bacterium]